MMYLYKKDMRGDFITLIFSLALTCSGQLVCTEIRCGENIAPICYRYNRFTNSAVCSACSPGYYCPFIYAGFNINYLCEPEPAPTVTYSSLPGMSCNITSQCISEVVCTNNICIGLDENSQCSSTLQCAPGLYCKTLNDTFTGCLPLLLAGSACMIGDACTYGYECNFGVCTAMYSIAIGSQVDSYLCFSSGFSSMCLYLQCYSVNSTYSICINPYENVLPYDTPCTTCVGKSVTDGIVYETSLECFCGLGGHSYCPGFLGDGYGSKYYELLKEYFLSSYPSICNIYAGIFCMRDNWPAENYWKFTYYYWLTFLNYRYINASACVYENLDQQFTYIKTNYENNIQSSSSSSTFSSSSSQGMLEYSAFILSLLV